MLIIVVFLSLLASFVSSEHPKKLTWYQTNIGNYLMGYSFNNLTLAMIKDAFYKLRMADRIQEQYKDSATYELGILASGIMEKFRLMIQIYKFYSNGTNFVQKKHSVNEILNGYHILQSSYNELRAEKDMFTAVLLAHNRKLEEEAILKQKKKRPNKLSFIQKQASKPVQTFRKFMAADEEMNNQQTEKREGIPIPATQRDKKSWSRNTDPEEAEYRKKLRYEKWAEDWKGFNPETEGVYIHETLVKIGLANQSDFLLNELKGNV